MNAETNVMSGQGIAHSAERLFRETSHGDA